MMSSIKMDELLVSWLGSDDVYENVMELIETYRQAAAAQHYQDTVVEQLKQIKQRQREKQQAEEDQQEDDDDDDDDDEEGEAKNHHEGGGSRAMSAASDKNNNNNNNLDSSDVDSQSSPRGVIASSSSSIPPFYRHYTAKKEEEDDSAVVSNERRRRRRTPLTQYDTWDPLPDATTATAIISANGTGASNTIQTTTATSSTPNDVIPPSISSTLSDSSLNNNNKNNTLNQQQQQQQQQQKPNIMAMSSVRDQVLAIFAEFGQEEDAAAAATTATGGGDNGSTSSPNMATASSSSSADSGDSVHSGTMGGGGGATAITTGRSHSPNMANQQQQDDNEADDDDGTLVENKIITNAPSVTSLLGSPARPMPDPLAKKSIPPHAFGRITKDICRFPSFFCHPLYHRILDLWNMEKQASQQEPLSPASVVMGEGYDDDDDDPLFQQQQQQQLHQHQYQPETVVTLEMMEWFWKTEMEPHDPCDRFYRLVKQPHLDYICRDDFLPFVKALLQDHPGLEFLASHSEFQEKYAVTVITRIFYAVNKCHSGRITSRQVRRSDLCAAFHQVDEEEDINKVTRYFSYEHFYVLYCRFWELDHDRDYRITREDLLKYGDHSLSHMIVDRIFDAAPRPFEQERPNRDFLSYEDFIYFMLSEEDKSNEVAVRYWFTCVDVDGDGKLNNMEMRSFYAVQLHRMQCMGHEIVPFEDMLCQMMDMIKPKNADFLIAQDFLQPECCQVSGALFDALFNLNKYLLFEQRDPFVERQKREDEFECDWDRFACIDYNRLAMEEEAREEEAMEIDWVTVEEEEDDAVAASAAAAAAQAGISADQEYQYPGGGGGGGGGPIVSRHGNAPF